MTNENRQMLNPWSSIWTQPRATIQQIVDTNPRHSVLVLAALAGIGDVLNRASVKHLGDHLHWPMILLLAAVIGPIGGILGLYVAGALLRWTGKWLGGNAPIEHVRAAVAWSNVPVIWALTLWVPQIAIFGQELFTAETPRISAHPALIYSLLGFGVIDFTVGIWTLVVFFKCLGQVQGFTAWKAVGNSLLATLIIIVPIALTILGYLALTR